MLCRYTARGGFLSSGAVRFQPDDDRDLPIFSDASEVNHFLDSVQDGTLPLSGLPCPPTRVNGLECSVPQFDPLPIL